MSVSLERLARNQVLFPEVNERLREMIGDSEAPTEFLCECSNADCSETIALDLDEYEGVRSSPNLFAVSRDRNDRAGRRRNRHVQARGKDRRRGLCGEDRSAYA
jgi:hypothetical protein